MAAVDPPQEPLQRGNLVEEIRDLVRADDPRAVLQMFTDAPLDAQLTRLLYIRPTGEMLAMLADSVRHFNLRGICSIGPGTGLLEWLIHRVQNIEVYGIERQSSRTQGVIEKELIPIEFVEEGDPHDTLPELRPSYALMQCYGHSPRLFHQYLEKFTKLRGPKIAILIGKKGPGGSRPAPDCLTTNPHWRVHQHQKFRNIDVYIYQHVLEE